MRVCKSPSLPEGLSLARNTKARALAQTQRLAAMSHLRIVCALYLALLAPLMACPARAADELVDRIDSITRDRAYKHSRWGILVSDLETGKSVYERDADLLFAPASVTKLYSGAAALIGLGADYKFETPVYARGELREGRLHGDLILVAKGDLCLGGRTDSRGRLAFRDTDHIYAGWLNTKAALTDTDPLAGLTELARQVRESGVRRVDGEVLIDARLFDRAHGSGSGPVLLTPIVVNDNLLDVTITPAAEAGKPATISLRPANNWAIVDAQVDTVRPTARSRFHVDHVGPQRYVVRGQVPAGGKAVVRICPIDEPVFWARALFIDCLRREGVRVNASGLATPGAELPDPAAYGRLKKVATYTSPPFSEYLRVTLKVSHNLYASIFPLLLAVKEGKRSLADGMHIQRKILTDLDVDVADISLESGAGGGNGDRVTPRATVQLLQGMAKRKDFTVFKEALPVLGVDGTLADAVGPDSPAKGHAWAKTGTYGDMDVLNDRTLLRSKALAGYLTTKSGRKLAFCIFVNEVPQPPGDSLPQEGKVIGKLCEVLYEHVR